MVAVELSLAPFVAVTSRLAAASDGVELRVELPTDPEWIALPEALEAAPRWHAALTVQEGDARTAASYLAAWIAEVPGLLVGVPVVLGAPAPEVEPDDLHVRRHADGWFDGLAIDPLGPDRTGVPPIPAAAATIHRLTAPLVDELTARLPIGRAAAWGSVADAVAGQALHVAHAIGEDPDAAWAAAGCLLDALEQHLPGRLVRPEPLFVPWSGGVRRHQTRGTCCLYHRTCDEPVDGDGSCATCPLRSHGSRVARLAAWLESLVADAGQPS